LFALAFSLICAATRAPEIETDEPEIVWTQAGKVTPGSYIHKR